MDLPLVSCIMPTADRLKFIANAIANFLHQDYANTELIILDDGKELASALVPTHPRIHYYYTKEPQKIGPKRNFLCDKANGEIIIHLDDDDWYAPDWISKQVEALINSGADITGLENINYLSTIKNKTWHYKNATTGKPWVYGGTLAYLKFFWEKHPFKDMQTGEDNDFIGSYGAYIYAHQYTEGYLGIIHTNNLGIKLFEDPKEKLQQEKWIVEIDKPEEYRKTAIKPSITKYPLVTCIMPTANRSDFVAKAIDNFIKQDYPLKDLVIIDDGLESMADRIPNDSRIKYHYSKEPLGKIGTKRNIACEKAEGELIIHWDDDDWYAPDWISYQVETLLNSKADICGINQVQFFSPSLNLYWMTKNRNSKQPWLTGASLIYRKSFWEQHHFKDLQAGEDNDFIRNTGAKVFAHDYFEGFIATLHPNNTSSRYFQNL